MNFKLFRLINYPTLWIAPAASKILDSLLDRSHTCLEYGSGISTIFLSQRVGNLVSIEHYQPWFDKVNQLLRKNAITNVDYRFVSGREIKKQPEKLTRKIKHQIQFGDSYFEYSAYTSEVNSFPENHFDIALIDGRSRVQCLLNSLPKIKEGGVIILDNSERSKYNEIHKALHNYPKITTTTGLTDTTFWFKTKK